jgi:hypothetical protein
MTAPIAWGSAGNLSHGLNWDFVGWLVLVEQVALYGSACGQLGLALATPAVNELAGRGRIMLAVDVWDDDLDGHLVEVGQAPIAPTGRSAAPMSRPPRLSALAGAVSSTRRTNGESLGYS